MQAPEACQPEDLTWLDLTLERLLGVPGVRLPLPFPDLPFGRCSASMDTRLDSEREALRTRVSSVNRMSQLRHHTSIHLRLPDRAIAATTR